MADVKIDDGGSSDHLIIDVDVVEEEHVEKDEVHDMGAQVEITIGAGAGEMSTQGAAEEEEEDVPDMGAGVETTNGGGWAITTAGAGSVTISGGRAAGGINTSGAGSVKTTYNTGGVPPPAGKGSNVEWNNTGKIPWTVGVIGGLTQATAAAAVLCRSPRGVASHGGEVAYLVGIASVFVAGLAEIAAAFWISIDTQKRGAAGKKILCVSTVFTLLLAIALVLVAIVPKM